MNQNLILSLLSKNPDRIWSVKDIARHFKIKGDQRRELRALLKSLARNGDILRHRGSKYGNLKSEDNITGILKMHYDGFGFVVPEQTDIKDVFIPFNSIGNALPDDKVLVAITQKKHDGRLEGRVKKVLEHTRKIWVGQFEKQGDENYVVNRDLSADLNIFIHPNQTLEAQSGQMVVCEITNFPEDDSVLEGRVLELLGERLDEKTESAAILVKHNIPRNFDKKVVEEALKIDHESLINFEKKSRFDLTQKAFITIDGLTAKDFDDAVYCEETKSGFNLYVAIADVAAYIKKNSILDKDAYQRATSVYFPDFVVPMLVEQISNNYCSLKPGEDRLALICEIQFDDKANMKNTFLYEAVIKSHKRGVYEEIQSFFDSPQTYINEDSAEIENSLLLLKKLAEKLIKKRKNRGALDFDFPEPEVIYDHTGQVTAISHAKRFFSHRLIEEMMISANVAVATFFANESLPLLYRLHDDPDESKIQNFVDFVKNLKLKNTGFNVHQPKIFAEFLESIKDHPYASVLHMFLLRSLKQAYYSPEVKRHFGLYLKHYCHFTSPIRRYPDLTVHRQIKFFIGKSKTKKIKFSFEKKNKGKTISEPTDYTFDQLTAIGKHSSQKERSAMEAERAMMSYKKIMFMKNHVGELFFGIIRRITKFGMYVELTPHCIEGLLHVRELKDDYYHFDEKLMRLVGRKTRKKKIFHVGDSVKVKILRIDFEEKAVYLEQVNN